MLTEMTIAHQTTRLSRILLFAVCLVVCGVSIAEEQLPATGKTFAWVKQNVHFYDAARFPDWNIKQELESGIIAAFEAKGLKFVDSIEDADLGLSYIAVLENAATPTEIAEFRETHPHIAALPNDPQKFEGGMLFAKLVDLHTRVKVWDNTYRGMVALDMPAAPREQRMQELLTTLLSNYKP